MMISPQGYIEQHKDKPLEELIKERNKLIETLKEYEDENILNNKPKERNGLIIDPSPEVVYSCYNDYLNEITDLIIERQKEKKVKTSIDKVIDNKKNADDITAGVFGFVIGDCLGVPVEFKNRYWLKSNPVKDMLEKGSHFQPKGTWSDDSSMVLATIHSLIELKGYSISNSFYDMADKFVDWYKNGLYSPNGEAFDIGNTTRAALEKFIVNRNKECGEGSLYDNGNGSLMRILPLAYYFYKTNTELEQRKSITFEVSSITHNHIMSKYACLMYVEYLLNILQGTDKYKAYKQMIETIEVLLKSEAKQDRKIISEAYNRILNGKIDKLKERDIKSSGYVVDTLEAVLWIVLNSKEYKKSVLEAVNLGDDTDTVGALSGGLLGAIYGFDSIPFEWINTVIDKDDILSICRRWEATKFNTADEYVTIGGEILNQRDISKKYAMLYRILGKYRNYNKKINLKKIKRVDKYAFQIIKELSGIEILCRNYNDITRVTTYELKESNNKKSDISKLNVLECLSLITVIHRESYWDGGYTEVFYKYTENEILPLLVNRILDIIESTLIVDDNHIKILLTYLFYYTIIVKGEEGSLKDSIEILETDEIKHPKVVFTEKSVVKPYNNYLKKLSNDEYIVVKSQVLEILNNYINMQKHEDLRTIFSDETLLALVEKVLKENNEASWKKKLNRDKLYSKLWEYKKQSRDKKINDKEYVLGALQIIEKEFENYKPIKDDNFVFGARQSFCAEEFNRYIQEGKITESYYDIEDFIGFQWIPADMTNGIKESKYICEKEVKVITKMINKLKLAYKGVTVEKKSSNEKEFILKIKHTNWGMIGPNDWTEVRWKIYKDLTVDIEKSYNRVEQNIETASKKITKKDYDNILKNIELSKENSVVVEACDGSAWEMIQYEKGQEVWKKELGYIYGIKPLEEITKIVMKLC